MELRMRLQKNILSAIIEKGIVLSGQFLTMFLVIRLLPRELYGFMGIAAGLFTFVHFMNLSLESILYRDHKSYESRPSFYLRHFLYFTGAKALIILLLGATLSVWGIYYYQSTEVLYAIASFSVIFAADAIIAPFMVYASSTLRHQLITKISVVRNTLTILSSFGLIYFPSLRYLFVRDLLISFLMMACWLVVAKHIFKLDLNSLFSPRIYLRFYRKTLVGYSLWVHFIGVTTNFIYKADTLFLSFFAGMHQVGTYSVALNSANVANILPSILGQQASIALSHSHDENKRYFISGVFFRMSLYLGLITLIGFVLFGRPLLALVTGDSDVERAYFYLLSIVAGLVIVKSIASPLVSYINIYGDVKKLFFRVNLPVLLFSSATYFISALLWQGTGVALANILNALFWALLVLLEITRYQFPLRELLRFSTDIKEFVSLMRGGQRAL